ncbi:uncharacterized protein LOC100875870 [Megachile rotundata]|uniref:uncharacterized protein LOC100875870 n=1 Tax=Megachile rotundata TaxID=143995 RepID=UPI000258EA47|nr:PREDICTED: DNA ligase 1-like [Megachile rotundata]XP_012145476.1 PREDICTED: DNA ligase 1-like [Megachile rotundata]
MATARSKARTQKKNATTQTSPTDTMIEIAHLQEQVKLLTIENDHLRKYTTEELSSRLKPTTPLIRPNDIENTPKRSKSVQRNLQTPSTQEKGNKFSTRCACKGKCFSKHCGCVKKNVLCGALCKCDITICKNQENRDEDQNKENLENNELAPKNIENKEINNKHLSNAAESKSMFSPDVTQGDSDFNIEEVRESLYFGSPKQLVFDTNKEEDEEEENEKRTTRRGGTKKSAELDENNQKSATKRNVRLRKLFVDADATKNRKQQENKNILNKEEEDLNDKETKRGVRRSIPDLVEPQMDEKIKENSMVSLRHGQKGSKVSKNKPNGRYVNNVESEVVQKKSPDSTANNTGASRDEINNASKLFEQKGKNSEDIKTSSKNESYSINENDNNDFNPMQPKHELTRTPIRGFSTSSEENTDISLTTSVKSEEERQIPEVFNQPEVDWEEYQSQLVACRKCKRKFHPLRIKKHESCCKKV